MYFCAQFTGMRKHIGLYLLISILTVFALDVQAQNQPDTSRTRKLSEVNINANSPQKVFTGPAVVQQISAEQIRELPTLLLSDALKYMSGVVVRDYGGTGGMKTVSVRGLGTQHTGVAYDDIALTDCQTGQIDLGKLSLENVSSLALVDCRFGRQAFRSRTTLFLQQSIENQHDKCNSCKTVFFSGWRHRRHVWAL